MKKLTAAVLCLMLAALCVTAMADTAESLVPAISGAVSQGNNASAQFTTEYNKDADAVVITMKMTTVDFKTFQSAVSLVDTSELRSNCLELSKVLKTLLESTSSSGIVLLTTSDDQPFAIYLNGGCIWSLLD